MSEVWWNKQRTCVSPEALFVQLCSRGKFGSCHLSSGWLVRTFQLIIIKDSCVSLKKTCLSLIHSGIMLGSLYVESCCCRTDRSVPSFIDYAQYDHGGSYTRIQVEDVKALWRCCRTFLLLIPFSIVHNQVGMLTSQLEGLFSLKCISLSRDSDSATKIIYVLGIPHLLKPFQWRYNLVNNKMVKSKGLVSIRPWKRKPWLLMLQVFFLCSYTLIYYGTSYGSFWRSHFSSPIHTVPLGILKKECFNGAYTVCHLTAHGAQGWIECPYILCLYLNLVPANGCFLEKKNPLFFNAIEVFFFEDA